MTSKSSAEEPPPITIDAAEVLPPISASVVVRMDPLTYSFEHDLQDLSHRFTKWFVDNISRLTTARGADLFVLVQLSRDGKHAGTTYREGQFLKSEGDENYTQSTLRNDT